VNSAPAPEEPLVFGCGGESLLGILHRAGSPIGVVMIVGGPQYRAGSHRFFTHLARAFARAGCATLRFDVRGMGDSTGDPRSFEDLDTDIAAAIDALLRAESAVQQVVLWGLCDAASAALLYWQRRRDKRVVGMCLLNPWVRSYAGLAKAQIDHYYGRRLLQASFWLKLLHGGIGAGALTEWWNKWRDSHDTPSYGPGSADFRQRMAQGWSGFPGHVLLVTSGQDLTAKEFLAHAATDPTWAGILHRPRLAKHDRPQADHTFSDRQQGQQAAQAMLDWLSAIQRQTT
jgi:exosortase A-associated hydrolase 1